MASRFGDWLVWRARRPCGRSRNRTHTPHNRRVASVLLLASLKLVKRVQTRGSLELVDLDRRLEHTCPLAFVGELAEKRERPAHPGERPELVAQVSHLIVADPSPRSVWKLKL